MVIIDFMYVKETFRDQKISTLILKSLKNWASKKILQNYA